MSLTSLLAGIDGNLLVAIICLILGNAFALCTYTLLHERGREPHATPASVGEGSRGRFELELWVHSAAAVAFFAVGVWQVCLISGW